MKRRRTALIAFLVLAVATLSIGYAALSDILDIQGTAEVTRASVGEAYNVDVYFDDTVVLKMYSPEHTDVTDTNLNMPKNSASVNDADKDKATMTIGGLSRQGEYVVVTYTVKNDSAYDATVILKSQNNSDGTNFEVTHVIANNGTVAAGQSVEVTVTVKLLSVPTETTMSTSFTIELEAVTGDLQ